MNTKKNIRRLPEWMKKNISCSSGSFNQVNDLLKQLDLATVCQSAHCPNQSECFGCGTATFMIMGKACTRNCRFCAVDHDTPTPLQADEPERIAQAASQLNLKHVVVTSVTRDDLPDQGASHFANTISELRKSVPDATIEVLTPDFSGDTNLLDIVAEAGPDVFNHNVETTRRLTPQIRNIADYDRSLSVLKYMSQKSDHKWLTKSGFMLGLGEESEEIPQLLHDLYNHGVQMLTIGQYLCPGNENIPVAKFYHPDEFEQIKDQAMDIGFKHVAAGPFVRSSYHAGISLDELK